MEVIYRESLLEKSLLMLLVIPVGVVYRQVGDVYVMLEYEGDHLLVIDLLFRDEVVFLPYLFLVVFRAEYHQDTDSIITEVHRLVEHKSTKIACLGRIPI
ncbi:MAG: hypothetical protein ACTSUE_01385 [Promethearchaeota archaeon]